MSVRLAIEIGGTKLQAAAGTPEGQILDLRRCPVPAGSAAKDVIGLVERLAQGVAVGRAIEQVGIGFGGPVDAAAGRVLLSHHVAGWEGFPLVQWGRQQFAADCVIENDTNCGALAEARLGAGAGASVVFYTNIGSGIGGGIVLDGKLYTRPGGAAEIGHTKLWDPRTGDYCIVEHLCSGWSIDRMARQLAAAGELPRALALAGGDVEALTAEHVAAAAGEGEGRAGELIERAAGDFAVGLCNVIALLNPEKIVVGGGVSLMGETFFGPLRKAVAERVFRPYAENYEIAPAALGESVVLVGALLIQAGSRGAASPGFYTR